MRMLKLSIIGIVALLMTSCEFIESNTHTYVDLGLSVDWATCNIGAKSPEEAGQYFAWGEVYSGDGDFKDYKWFESSGSEITNISKYNSKTDNITTLLGSDDVATKKWGYGWRMPTFREMEELMTKCTWNFTNKNAVPGYNVIGPNGNSIFLPVSGQYLNSEKYYFNHSGFYWTSSLHKENCFQAFSLRLESDEVYMDVIQRHIAQTVRAVKP